MKKPFDTQSIGGNIFIEHDLKAGVTKGDIGIKVATDGRIWVCLNGIAAIRYSPNIEDYYKTRRQNKKGVR